MFQYCQVMQCSHQARGRHALWLVSMLPLTRHLPQTLVRLYKQLLRSPCSGPTRKQQHVFERLEGEMELPLHALPLCCQSLVTGYLHRMEVLSRPTAQ
jgi:hypothetical protein